MKCRKLLLLFILFLFPIFVSSLEVRTRTKDNLYLPDGVELEEDKVEDVLNTPSVIGSLKLYDFVDVFSQEEEKEIYQKIKEYTKNTKLDCVIVTTDDLGGKTISNYGYDFYDYNEFLNEGVIFVIYIHDDTKDIFMGNNGGKNSIVFSTYTDDRIHDILKYVYKNIKINDYYQASMDFITLISKFYEVSNESFYQVDENGDVVYHLPVVEILIISISLTFIICFLLYKMISKREENIHMKKLDTNTMIVQVLSDQNIS